jgi:hypothetical protein
MTTKKQDAAGPRPADLHPEAVWPPRVKFDNAPVTVTDASVARKAPVPEGGFGVRVGGVPMSGDAPREQLADIPTDGPGVPRRAIPAPEEAETTGTIPPPHTMHFDGHRDEVKKGRDASPVPTTVHTAPAPRAAKVAPRARKRAGQR